MKTLLTSLILLVVSLFSCSANDDPPITPKKQFKYLALGDSYTIGESVCATCNFPEQLKSKLQTELNAEIELEIIATTGWTTTNLKAAIQQQNPTSDQDLVTLLIGVNNQYQQKPFSLYETEFPELLNKTVVLAKGNKNNVIVVSIPDYAYTPFGNGNATVSQEIDAYNTFATDYCQQMGIQFANITDITRQGLSNPNLVADDGLHPSALAYSRFVERLLPISISKLSD